MPLKTFIGLLNGDFPEIFYRLSNSSFLENIQGALLSIPTHSIVFSFAETPCFSETTIIYCYKHLISTFCDIEEDLKMTLGQLSHLYDMKFIEIKPELTLREAKIETFNDQFINHKQVLCDLTSIYSLYLPDWSLVPSQRKGDILSKLVIRCGTDRGVIHHKPPGKRYMLKITGSPCELALHLYTKLEGLIELIFDHTNKIAYLVCKKVQTKADAPQMKDYETEGFLTDIRNWHYSGSLNKFIAYQGATNNYSSIWKS